MYERALGATTMHLQRFGDTSAMETPPKHADRVMHATLQIGAGVMMVGDSMDDSAPADTNVHVSLAFDDLDDMAKRFDALAAGGTITMPLHDAFWGARFGMLTDAYGIRWMFVCETRR
jgi:PhnB protein